MKKGKEKIQNKLTDVNARIVSKNIIKTKNGMTLKKQGANTYAYNPSYYNFNQGRPEVMFGPKSPQEEHRVWRTLYKFDPIAGTCIDIFSELPWSDFIISNIEDPAIKEIFEIQKEKTNLLDLLPEITREYLTLGKAIIHNTFDSSSYLWKDIILQNPDYVDVLNMPLFSREPLLTMIPDQTIKTMLKNKDPRVFELCKKIPKEILTKLITGQKIPLSNENTTYLYRKISGYDSIGTSLMSRLYKIVMYEDAIYNASIAVAQRNAAPLRLFKLGDPNSGWIPTPEQEQQFIDMLMQAEADPYSVLVYHYGIEVDYIGVSDRLMSISREWDFISQVKFMALGMSRELVSGESTYASMQGSLQVMTERLRSLRQKIENAYIIEKFFKPIARVHKFYKRTPAQIKHNIYIKNSPADQERDLIVPSIKWQKVLEGTKDSSLLNLWDGLRNSGACSLRTYAAGAGIDLDEERKNIKEENEWNQKNQMPNPEEGGDPSFKFGSIRNKNQKENVLRNLSQISRLKKEAGGKTVPSEIFNTKIWDNNGNFKGLNYKDIEDSVRMASKIAEKNKKELDWETIDSILQAEGISESKIGVAKEILEHEGIIATELPNKTFSKSSSHNLDNFINKFDGDSPNKLGQKFLTGI